MIILDWCHNRDLLMDEDHPWTNKERRFVTYRELAVALGVVDQRVTVKFCSRTLFWEIIPFLPISAGLVTKYCPFLGLQKIIFYCNRWCMTPPDKETMSPLLKKTLINSPKVSHINAWFNNFHYSNKGIKQVSILGLAKMGDAPPETIKILFPAFLSCNLLLDLVIVIILNVCNYTLFFVAFWCNKNLTVSP